MPDYARELAAFQSVVTITHEAGKASKFTRRLVEVADAGFLDELVWTDRHREEWGAQPPAGLDLEAFGQWRKKKLKRFAIPDFGSVSYDSPRHCRSSPRCPPRPSVGDFAPSSRLAGHPINRVSPRLQIRILLM